MYVNSPLVLSLRPAHIIRRTRSGPHCVDAINVILDSPRRGPYSDTVGNATSGSMRHVLQPLHVVCTTV